MSNLVIMKDKRAVTSSMNIADNFKKEHRNVMRDIRELEKDVLNFEQMFVEGVELDSYGRDRTIYYMNRDGFTLLAMGFTGKKALEFKLKYIQAFNQMETQLIELSKDSYMIEDPVKRAERWIQERKQVQMLELENLQLKPKAIFADSVSASETSILISDLAKLLKQNDIEIGGTRLFDWLRENGYLIKRKGTDYNMPTQKSMDLKLFRIKETAINHNSGRISISKTPKVTGKGQLYFINKFLVNKNKVGIGG